MTRRKGRQGALLFEFALVLPILLMVVTGLIVFGQILHSWLLITNASREGARAGAVGKTNSQIETIVRERAATLVQDNLAVTISPASQGSRVLGNPLQVEVDYNVPIELPVYDVVLPNPFPIEAATAMRIENLPS